MYGAPASLSSRIPLFFFNATATTEIYTLSLHDALPISPRAGGGRPRLPRAPPRRVPARPRARRSEEHTSELQSLTNLVCRLLLEKKKTHTTGNQRNRMTGTTKNTQTFRT